RFSAVGAQGLDQWLVVPFVRQLLVAQKMPARFFEMTSSPFQQSSQSLANFRAEHAHQEENKEQAYRQVEEVRAKQARHMNPPLGVFVQAFAAHTTLKATHI